jgi:hypothetical protein
MVEIPEEALDNTYQRVFGAISEPLHRRRDNAMCAFHPRPACASASNPSCQFGPWRRAASTSMPGILIYQRNKIDKGQLFATTELVQSAPCLADLG